MTAQWPTPPFVSRRMVNHASKASWLTLFVLLSAAARIVAVQDPSSVYLSGIVSSQKEGPMEGVLVSAKRAGSTFTVTVVSDAQGRYSFPRQRLEPGQYS